MQQGEEEKSLGYQVSSLTLLDSINDSLSEGFQKDKNVDYRYRLATEEVEFDLKK